MSDYKVTNLVGTPTDYSDRNNWDYLPENKGDRLAVKKPGELFASEFEHHKPGLADARLDVERVVVVCTTLTDRYFKNPIPDGVSPLGPASLHEDDYTAYWEENKNPVSG